MNLFESSRPWQVYVAIALIAVMAGSAIQCVINDRDERLINCAPHLAASDLYEICSGGAQVRPQIENRLVVITGRVNGVDEGLIGDGALHIDEVECEVNQHYGPCDVGDDCTVAGVCDLSGFDKGYILRLLDAKVLRRGGSRGQTSTTLGNDP